MEMYARPAQVATQTVNKVHTSIANPLYSVHALRTSAGWTTYHIYVGRDFIYSTGPGKDPEGNYYGSAVHDSATEELKRVYIGAAIQECERAHLIKWGNRTEGKIVKAAIAAQG